MKTITLLCAIAMRYIVGDNHIILFIRYDAR